MGESGFISDVASNFVANVLFWLGGGLIFGFVVSWKRRQLARFFGLSKSRNLSVYLSSFVIQPETLKDRLGIVRSHSGIGIPNTEFQVIPGITTLFGSSLSDKIPGVVVGLVDTFWLISRPLIEYMASPQDERAIHFSNIICLGSPKFNAVTGYYMRTGNPYFTISEENGQWQVNISRGSRAGEVLTTTTEKDLGVLLKIKDAEHKTTVIIAAGLGVNGTRAAAEYLVNNWWRLHRDYGDNEFGLCIECPYIKVNPNGYLRPFVKMELPE